MTNEQTKQNGAAMIASADGRSVQWSKNGIPIGYNNSWHDCGPFNVAWDFVNYSYRPKPEPVTRPWSKPEDVPGPVCWLRSPGCSDAVLIVAIEDTYILIGSGDDEYKWEEIADWKYTTDRKTWHKCEVSE